jgi:hypothetical protein
MFIRSTIAAVCVLLLTVSGSAAQTYPSPTVQNITILGTCNGPGCGEPSNANLTSLSNAVNEVESFLVQTSLGSYEWVAGVISNSSMSSLRANTIPWPTIHVQGYYGAGTAGGGDFEYTASDTTTSDNGGTIIVDASSHRYYRVWDHKALSVTWFGAKSDGHIITAGVQTSTSSPTISSGAYTFTSADAGAQITLTNPAPINSASAPSNTFVGTISGASSGNGTLSGNAGFTSTTYQYAAARFYHTDDTTAVQNALNAGHTLQGAEIDFPAGVTAGCDLVYYSNERIVGASNGASTVMMTNGCNGDIFISYQFASLVGTNNTGGVGNWAFEDITLDGNRGDNTASGTGTPTGTGDGLRTYGYKWNFKNLNINYMAGDAFYTEWSSSGGSPFDNNGTAALDGMEATGGYNYNSFYNGGYCLVWNGPHDSQIEQMFCSANGMGDILYGSGAQAANGGPLKLGHFHGYNSNGVNIDLENNALECDFCSLEQGVLVNSLYNTFISTQIATLTIGKSSGGVNPVYDLEFLGGGVNLIVNNTGSGAGDQWLGAYINGISGGDIGSYTPQISYGNKGLANSIGSSLTLQNGASQALVMAQSSGSVFTITDGTLNFVLTAPGALAFGPSATIPINGAGLDLSADLGANLSSLLLPADTTANRPGTPQVAMLRYNTTLGAFEGYQGSTWATFAGLNVPESFTAAQRATPAVITISTSTFTPNFNTAQNFSITLVHASCPCKLANPSTTLVAGQAGVIEVHQSSTGSDTIGTWDGDYQYVGGTAAITLSTGADAVDYLPYYVNNAGTGIVLGSILNAPAH